MTRINQFIARLSGISRRRADRLVESGKILVNNQKASPGQQVKSGDKIVSIDPEFKFNHTGDDLPEKTLITLNKPIGYVCSRNGQGSKTVYDLLPQKFHQLKPVGRLDKDSSGLLLLTNDGELAHKLTHPRYQKEKIYTIKLNKPLEQQHQKQLLTGVRLQDGLSKFINLKPCSDKSYTLTIAEGRNRQIRRTLKALGYEVKKLHRTKFGNYKIGKIISGDYQILY